MSVRPGDRVTSLMGNGTYRVIREDDFAHTLLLEAKDGNQFWLSRLAVEKVTD